jgi:hypothetical protein
MRLLVALVLASFGVGCRTINTGGSASGGQVVSGELIPVSQLSGSDGNRIATSGGDP